MGSIDSALYTRLSTFAGLTALISTRIYPPPAPQNAVYPFITYAQVSGVRSYVMGNQSGLVQARFQVDIWDDDLTKTARTVAEQVRLALSMYRGAPDGVTVDLITIETEFRGDPERVDNQYLSHIIQEYVVTFRESLPS
jgi:hypothetical protein